VVGKAKDVCCNPDCKQTHLVTIAGCSLEAAAGEDQKEYFSGPCHPLLMLFDPLSQDVFTYVPSHCKVKGPAGLSYQAWTADVPVQPKVLSSSNYF